MTDTQQATMATQADDERWFYDIAGGKFWTTNSKDEWVSLPQKLFRNHLVVKGFSDFKDAGTGEVICKADAELNRTVMENRVGYVGPLAGWKKGLHWFEDGRALVTKSPTLINPAPGEFPVIGKLIDGLFRGKDEEDAETYDQTHYIFGWLKHTLEALYEGKPRQGLCVVFAGEAGCGKTLFKDLVKIMFGGRECYPYAWLTGKDNFNANVVESSLWTVDDERSDTDIKSRLQFGDAIKSKAVATSGLSVRGMHKDAITLNPLRRLVVCVNREPDKLTVLPPIYDDIADKISLFLCYKSPSGFPMPVETADEKRTFFDTLMEELPSFVHWLLNDYEIPDGMHGRFGVTHWHHPAIISELIEIGPEQRLLEKLDRCLFDYDVKWEGTTTELRNELVGEGTKLLNHEIKEVPQSAWIGKLLSKLAAIDPDRFTQHRKTKKRTWTIRRPSE